jgi:hypothetical protein
MSVKVLTTARVNPSQRSSDLLEWLPGSRKAAAR